MTPNFDFQEKFGHIAYFMTGGGLIYEQTSTGKLFDMPDGMTEAEIESLMEKSVSDNKDYVFELVKDNEFKLQENVCY